MIRWSTKFPFIQRIPRDSLADEHSAKMNHVYIKTEESEPLIGEDEDAGENIPLDDLERQNPGRIALGQTVSQPSQPNRADKSTGFLDGLRGVAALCVFTQHFIGGDQHHHGFGENGFFYFISFPFIRVFWSGGAAAVAIFFVLSGFVLSQSTVKLFFKGERQKCQKGLMSAVVRRPFRLYLPCWAVGLIIAFLIQIPGGLYPEMPWLKAEENLGAQLIHWFIATMKYFNPFQTHGWVFGVYVYDIVVWTIPIELKGSFLIYVLSLICCFGMSTAFWSSGFLLLTTITFLQIGWWWGGCFTGGLLLTIVHVYDLDNEYWLNRLKPWTRQVILHTIFFFGWYLLSQPAADGHPQWSLDTPGWHFLSLCIPAVYDKDAYYRFWQSYGAVFMVYSVLRLGWLQWIFGSRPLRYLGKVSFMLYLVHLPLMYVVGDRFVRIFGQIQFGATPSWQDNLLYVPDIGPKGLSLRWDIDWTIMLAISLGVAHLGTKFIDEPCVRLGRKISDALGLSSKKPS